MAPPTKESGEKGENDYSAALLPNPAFLDAPATTARALWWGLLDAYPPHGYVRPVHAQTPAVLRFPRRVWGTDGRFRGMENAHHVSGDHRRAQTDPPQWIAVRRLA